MFINVEVIYRNARAGDFPRCFTRTQGISGAVACRIWLKASTLPIPGKSRTDRSFPSPVDRELADSLQSVNVERIFAKQRNRTQRLHVPLAELKAGVQSAHMAEAVQYRCMERSVFAAGVARPRV